MMYLGDKPVKVISQDIISVSEAFTTRQTANGMTVVDPSPAIVKKIKGKTVKCKNLIPYPYTHTTKTVNGVTYTDLGDGGIKVQGTNNTTGSSQFILWGHDFKLPAGSYYLGGWTANVEFHIVIDKADGTARYPKNSAFTIEDSDTIRYVYLEVPPQGSVPTAEIVYPMLVNGTTEKAWQPYFTGLKHAHFEKIVSTGRNLLNAPTILDFSKGIYSQYYFNVDLTGTYTISYFLQGNEVTSNAAFLRVTVNGTSKYLAATSGVNRSYSLSITGHITQIAFINWAGFEGTATKITLNEGAALPYEPYTSNEFALSAPVQLPEWDYIYPQTGEIVRGTKTFVFDGTENWRLADASIGEFGVTASFVASMSQSKYGNGICNRYTFAPNGGFTDRTCRFAYGNGNTMYFYDKAFTTLEAWKAYLAELYANGNPLTISYLTKTTTEPLDIPKQYTAHNGGSETVVQGVTDNSEHGAKATVETKYVQSSTLYTVPI